MSPVKRKLRYTISGEGSVADAAQRSFKLAAKYVGRRFRKFHSYDEAVEDSDEVRNRPSI